MKEGCHAFGFDQMRQYSYYAPNVHNSSRDKYILEGDLKLGPLAQFQQVR